MTKKRVVNEKLGKRITLLGYIMRGLSPSGVKQAVVKAKKKVRRRKEKNHEKRDSVSAQRNSGSNSTQKHQALRCSERRDATWAGAQETHRWAWRLSLRGAHRVAAI